MNDLSKKYQFFLLTDKNKKEWDDFVLSSPFGSIHQISKWKNFQEHIVGRGPIKGFGIKEDGVIQATVLCVRMSTGFLGTSWWYSPRGPVCNPQTHPEACHFLLSRVAQELKKEKSMFWRLDPYFSKNDAEKVYTGGIHAVDNSISLPCFEKATQNYQPTDTLEINLKQTDDEILSDMKRKGRYNITLARKKGVQITALPNGSFLSKRFR